VPFHQPKTQKLYKKTFKCDLEEVFNIVPDDRGVTESANGVSLLVSGQELEAGDESGVSLLDPFQFLKKKKTSCINKTSRSKMSSEMRSKPETQMSITKMSECLKQTF